MPELGFLLPQGGFVFGGPGRYCQGPGAVDLLGPVLAQQGPSALLLVDAHVANLIGDRLKAICAASEVETVLHLFEGEITYDFIDAVIGAYPGRGFSAVAGIGGGKALDAAKAVALRLNLSVVTVPTIASNDSPTSATVAMYDANHTMVAIDRLPANPVAVIVDSALIAAAPARFLRAGIGDAISKKFEADGCFAGSGVTPFGTRPGLTAISIADACYRTLREHAVAALAAIEAGRITPDVEATIEATLLMSGLGFENGGLSLAHSLTRGLVRVRGTRDAIHGAQIAWAALVQLAAENRPDEEIVDLAGFLRQVGLPVNLRELGLPDATEEDLEALAHWTMTAPHLANMPVAVTNDSIRAAVARLEGLTSLELVRKV